ncbi:MAG: hypothetical protein ACT4NY_26775 [Pseudonocardiales bacterium]
MPLRTGHKPHWTNSPPHATGAEYRTVPIIGRARSLHTLLGQRPDLASSTLAALRDNLAEFSTHPAPTRTGTGHRYLNIADLEASTPCPCRSRSADPATAPTKTRPTPTR